MPKLRICRVTDSFPPPWSGLSPGIYDLTEAQIRSGVEVEVITKAKGAFEELDKYSPFAVHRVKGRLMVFEIIAFFKLIQLHREKKFDIIHSHGNSFFIFHLLRKLFGKRGILGLPLVLSIHNIRQYQDRTYRDADFFSLLENILFEKQTTLRKVKQKMLMRHQWQAFKQRICCRNTDLLFSVSKRLGEVLIDEILTSRIPIVTSYNGIGKAFLSSEYTGHVNPERKNLLFVGRITGTKNEITLLKAFSIVHQLKQELKLIMIGDGPWRITVEKVIKQLNLDGFVLIIPNVPHDEICDYYRRASVFVFPSFSEGFPKVLIEAMGSGCSVVASRVDGNTELIEDGVNGFLVDPYDYMAMAERIIQLLDNPELAKEFAMRARELVKNEFSWMTVATRYLQGYRQVIKA